MNQLCKPLDSVIKVLHKSKNLAGDSFRLLNFCILQPVTEGMLLYNTLTHELLLLEPEEADNLVTLESLRHKWCVVPSNFDDIRFSKQIRTLLLLLTPKQKHINSFTILPTSDCNARCFYCFELNRRHEHMSDATAVKVAEWMISQSQGKPIRILWFGGEPLFNLPAIRLIVDRLIEAGVEFQSRMISNGYLFDESLVHESVERWKLKSVQVTLDGTEETYNRCKAFIYREGSPYQRVMRNIGLLLEAGVYVKIRLNIDLHNASDLMALVEILYRDFGSYTNLRVYARPLYEVDGDDQSRPRSEEHRAEVFRVYHELEERIKSFGMTRERRISRTFRSNHCMADNVSSVVIAPSGMLSRCEHCIDHDFYASIDRPDVIDNEIYHSFDATCDDLDICQDCAYYPQCIRLKKCSAGADCNPQVKADRLEMLKLQMLGEYECWKRNQNKNK